MNDENDLLVHVDKFVIRLVHYKTHIKGGLSTYKPDGVPSQNQLVLGGLEE